MERQSKNTFFGAIIFNNIYLTIYFILSADSEQEKLLFGLACRQFPSNNCIGCFYLFEIHGRNVSQQKDQAQQIVMRF